MDSKWEVKKKVCREFAKILGGNGSVTDNNVCFVEGPSRPMSIKTAILNKPTKSPLVFTALFSFEDLGKDGRALNLGEIPLLEEEVSPFMAVLKKRVFW